MSGFKVLRDISNDFENYSRRVSAELFSAKIDEPFEDSVSKKMRDVLLLTAKLRLLQAKPLADTPQVLEKNKSEQSTILDYEETVSWKIIEQFVVKALTQAHTVKNLVTTSSSDLDSELRERKEKIIAQLTEYSQKEIHLRSLDAMLRNSESKLLEVQRKWDEVAGKLRDEKELHNNEEIEEEHVDGPFYKRLQSLTEKNELMRWLVAKLVTSRYDDGYDWSVDPDQRLRALAMARQRNDL